MLTNLFHASLAISFSLESFRSSDYNPENFAEEEGADVAVWQDKDLPDDPVSVLPVKEDFRLRIVIAQKQTRPRIKLISAVKVALPHKKQHSLPLVSVQEDSSRVEAVALLEPLALEDDRLLKPFDNSPELQERYLRLELTVYVRVSDINTSKEKIRHKIYCNMVNPAAVPSGSLFERKYTEAWEKHPEWKALGQSKSILLVQYSNREF